MLRSALSEGIARFVGLHIDEQSNVLPVGLITGDAREGDGDIGVCPDMVAGELREREGHPLLFVSPELGFLVAEEARSGS